MTLTKIEVKLSERSYPIFVGVGLRQQLREQLPSYLSPHCRKVVVISNATIFRLYGVDVCNQFTALSLEVSHYLIGDGERFKTLRTAEQVLAFLMAQNLSRHDLIVALGGGVVGDLAGFVAAIYLRGIDFIQIPTTLLAQIDAAIGGKTAVNHSAGKNLIGAFHQPKLVAIDPETLTTLPLRELKAALQEAIKYGVIADKKLFQFIDENQTGLLKQDPQLLDSLIVSCCTIKAGVVSRDEKETGERKILNFGHTAGHALEAATNYRRFKHGEAVGYGMLVATRIAQALELLDAEQGKSIETLVMNYGRLPKWSDINEDTLIELMKHDKKSQAGQLTFVLPESIGRVIIRQSVPFTLIHQILTELRGK